MSDFRRATLDDTISVGQMLRRFYAKAGAIYGIPYDHYSCLNLVTLVIQHGICLIGHGSCAGAMLDPFPFNRNVLVAQVIFWYFERPREIIVFDQLWHACAEAGAQMINSAALGPRLTGRRFYRARGLNLVEGHWFGQIQGNKKELREEERRTIQPP